MVHQKMSGQLACDSLSTVFVNLRRTCKYLHCKARLGGSGLHTSSGIPIHTRNGSLNITRCSCWLLHTCALRATSTPCTVSFLPQYHEVMWVVALYISARESCERARTLLREGACVTVNGMSWVSGTYNKDAILPTKQEPVLESHQPRLP